MKILYFDFIASGGVHTTFNSAMIEVLRTAFPECTEIILQSEEKHGQIVSKKCTGKITLRSERLLWSRFVKFSKVRDLLSIFYILEAIKKTSREDILYVGLAFPFTINLIWLITKLTGRKIYITLHGEMQYFLEEGYNTPQTKHNRYFKSMGFAFAHKNKNVTYVILGKSIYESVKFLFHPENKVIVINHPAIFREGIKIGELHHPIRIGQIGSAFERKGSDKLFEIAYLLKDEIKKRLVCFHVLGVCGVEITEEQKNLVSCFNDFLSEEKLASEIKDLDFTVQLTTDENCKAIASGTFIDSLIYDKPIIGLHSSYLDLYINDDTPMQNKLIFSSVDELVSFIKEKLISFSQDEYEKMIFSLQSVKENFNIEKNAHYFFCSK